MVVKIINGMRIQEPPYTQAEEDEFYRRVGGGPVTVAAQLVTVKSRRPQNSSSRRRQNRTALKSLLEPVDPGLPLADNPARVLNVCGAPHFADGAASAGLFGCCRAK